MDYSYFVVWSNRQTKKVMIFFLKYITVSHRHRASTVPSWGTVEQLCHFWPNFHKRQTKFGLFFPPSHHTHTQIFWRIFLNLWRIMMEIWEKGRSLRNLQIFAFNNIKVEKNGWKEHNNKENLLANKWQNYQHCSILQKKPLRKSLQNSIYFACTSRLKEDGLK